MKKKTINILLILLLSGLPSLLANTSFERECCHNPAPVEQEDSHSCCMNEEPVEIENTLCNVFEMTTSTLDNCGCIHELNEIDETILTNLKVDYSQLVLIDRAVPNDFSNTNEFSKPLLQNLVYFNSIPIYITVSSYLI